MAASGAPRVLLVGGEGAGARVLSLLLEREVEVARVLTAESPRTRGSVAAIAERAGIPLDAAERVTDPGLAATLAAERIDLLVNVHSLRIVCDAVVDAPAIGSFNLHPGPLPRYAGLDAPSWAVAAGEREHAVTLHRMEAAVDTGPIAYEAWFEVGSADTGLRVATECVRLGVPLIGQLVDDAATGAIPARPQDLTQRRWHGRRAPYGGQLPWTAAARRLVDLVRAADYSPLASPWGWFRTEVAGGQVEVGRASVVDDLVESEPPGAVVHDPDGTVRVAAADGWVAVERTRRGGEAVDPATALPPGTRCAVGPPPVDGVLDGPLGAI